MPSVRISLLPFLTWLPTALKSWRADLVASFSVSILLIPQSLAYAEIAGLPPYFGLYASLLPPIVASFWGSSPYLSTGPAVVISLLTFSALSEIAPPQTSTFIVFAAALALLVGIVQLGMGFFKLGNLIHFISHPVIKGFVSAAAIIIILTQVPKFLNLPIDNHEALWQTLVRVSRHIATLHPLSLLFGVVGLLGILVGRRFTPRLPNVFFVAGLSTFISWWIGYDGAVVGLIPRGLPAFQIPTINAATLQLLTPSALIIALVGYMEAMSIAKSLALKTRTSLNPNQELIGQGLANLTAGLGSTFPIGGSFSRSAINYSSGVKSGLATVFTGLILMVALLFFTPLLYHLPQAILAAIIVASVLGLIDIKGMSQLWKMYPRDGIVAYTTFFATFIFAPHLDYGIAIGFLMSLITYAYRASRPPIMTFNFADASFLRSSHINIHPYPSNHHVLGVSIDHSLIFTNADHFKSRVQSGVQAFSKIRYVLILSRGINLMDATACEVIEELVDELRSQRIRLMFAGMKPSVAQHMYNTNLHKIIGRGNLFVKVKDALKYIHLRESASKKHSRKVTKKNSVYRHLVR